MYLFKNPDISGSEESDDLVDEIEMPFVVVVNDSDASSDEDDDELELNGLDDSSNFDPEEADSDYSMDSENEVFPLIKNPATATTQIEPSVSVSSQKEVGDGGANVGGAASSLDYDEDAEDDETVRAIIAAIKKPRTSPPEIKLEDFVTDISFHPERDIIAIATIAGDVCLYKFSNEGNRLLRTVEAHAKAIRDVEFTESGHDLLTCSKDKSILVTDMETEKLKKFYETAHDVAINKLLVIDENLFASGDDGGTVKLWDLRTKNAIFALKEVEDYITQMLTSEANKLLLVCSGDGYLTTLNIAARKLFVKSEPYEEEPTCMATYRGESKLTVGTSNGRLYTYNWGQFGYHCDMYPGIKTPISVMIPITDRIGCVAGEDGIIRACHVAPYRNLGIVGQHNMPVESLDTSSNGELIASASHNNDVRFWNVKYFEEFDDIKYNEKHNTYKETRHNLPSSKFSNASDFFSDLAKSQSDED